MKIFQPVSSNDMDTYFHFRWKLLRAPWNQPIGSEKDELEDSAFHIMATNDQDIIVGVGRIHTIDITTAQIRYMAVSPENRNQGIGSMIINTLELQARSENISKLILNARDSAIGFYQRHSYQSIGKAHTLYNQISHTQMQKELRY